MTGDTDVCLGRFSVRYDKGGSEKKFGMFGYGSSADLAMPCLGFFSGRTAGIGKGRFSC